MILMSDKNSVHGQAGMSLVETLVALLVFSVGTVGVAGMMLTGARNNDATLLRTQSTMLANEIYEKILANVPAAEAGNYDLAKYVPLPDSAEVDCTGLTSVCTPSQVAEWDVGLWGVRLERVLRGADADIVVTVPANPEEPLDIRVRIWFDPLLEIGDPANPPRETFNFRAPR